MKIESNCCGFVAPTGVTAPVFSWKVKECGDSLQLAYQIRVRLNRELVWDSGKVFSSESCRIPYQGETLKEHTEYHWTVTVYTEHFECESVEASFVTGLIAPKECKWIAADKKLNAPYLFKKFTLGKIKEDAVVSVCGLGYFELYLNGKKVSDEKFTPVRTDYDQVKYINMAFDFDGETGKKICYSTYRVNSYLKEGENLAVIWLGNGFYKQRARTIAGIFDYGEELKMFFNLRNGDEVVESDLTWKCAQSPILYDNIYYGEIYDARINSELLSSGTTTTSEYPVYPAKTPIGRIEPQLYPSDRAIERYTPMLISRKGCYDAGQCITGFAEITCKGKAGAKVEVLYAENINEEGGLDFTSTVGYEESDKNQIQKDVYILKGDEVESYTPRFVWHAFRYFVISCPDSVEIMDIKVHFVCTDLKKRAFLNSSSELLNSLYRICDITRLSNIHGCVPMDCPHRERMGYTGDGQASSLAGMYCFEGESFYRKWIEDILDAQNTQNGYVPHTAPFSGGGGGPAWGSAVAVVPWNFYTQYGDKSMLLQSREAIKKWLLFLSTRKNEKHFIAREEEDGWCLGDWCMPSEFTWDSPHPESIKIEPEYVNTIYYIYCINIYRRLLQILGEPSDYWAEEEYRISVEAINSNYLNAYYGSGEQGYDAFALFVDIVPENKKQQVLEHLIQKIEEKQYCMDTGILGTEFIFRVLDQYGRNDIVMKMLLNTDYPSYGYMLSKGATALWETWEGNGGHNHVAMLSVAAWFWFGLAGIKPNMHTGGYREFSIKPYFAKELDFLKAELECEYGKIGLSWFRIEKGIAVEIEVPFNTTANVSLGTECMKLQSGHYKYWIDMEA